MDVQNTTINNPSNMTGIFTKDGFIQGKNADEVIQIVNSLKPSDKAQIISGILGLAGTVLIFWGGYKFMKATMSSLNSISEDMKKEEKEEDK